jgi:hypothetical protein
LNDTNDDEQTNTFTGAVTIPLFRVPKQIGGLVDPTTYAVEWAKFQLLKPKPKPEHP